MSQTLIKSGDVQGLHVVGMGDAKLGAAREIFVDLATGTIGFVIIEPPSLLGGSGKYHPVPWSAVRFDSAARSLQIQMTKDDFKASPSYDREQLANPSFGWDEQSIRYFTSTPSA